MINICETFEKYSDDYLKFDLVKDKLNSIPDICAFLLLEKLSKEKRMDIIAAAEHDEIFLSTDCEELAKVATDNDILTLVRCGVRYDSEYGCLSMFV